MPNPLLIKGFEDSENHHAARRSAMVKGRHGLNDLEDAIQ